MTDRSTRIPSISEALASFDAQPSRFSEARATDAGGISQTVGGVSSDSRLALTVGEMGADRLEAARGPSHGSHTSHASHHSSVPPGHASHASHASHHSGR